MCVYGVTSEISAGLDLLKASPFQKIQRLKSELLRWYTSVVLMSAPHNGFGDKETPRDALIKACLR